jgi:rhodanese-related sulfurtransferase
MGYENVKDYGGGKSDWVEAGLPTESEHKHQEGR